jgi:hypothetical protein
LFYSFFFFFVFFFWFSSFVRSFHDVTRPNAKDVGGWNDSEGDHLPMSIDTDTFGSSTGNDGASIAADSTRGDGSDGVGGGGAMPLVHKPNLPAELDMDELEGNPAAVARRRIRKTLIDLTTEISSEVCLHFLHLPLVLHMHYARSCPCHERRNVGCALTV